LTAVTSADITDGEIVDADVSATAAIAANKIAVASITNLAATDVQGALAELQGDIDAATGDMTKAVYDTDDNGLVDNVETFNSTAIADIDGATGVTIDASGGAIGIGTNADAQPINIGIAGTRTITVGNASSGIIFEAGAAGVDINSTELAISGRAAIGNTNFLTAALTSTSNNQDLGATAVGGTESTIPLAGISLAAGGDIVASGNIYASAGLTFSDRRYKKHISGLQNALQQVRKLSGVTYFWKVDEFPDNNFSERKQIGLIAQEVEEVYPELVNTLPNGYKTVNYEAIVPILIEAIKEQQTLIEKLTAELTAEKSTREELTSALQKQQELTAMQMDLISSMQNKNETIEADLEKIKALLGLKASNKD
jgi:hypothetical protein